MHKRISTSIIIFHLNLFLLSASSVSFPFLSLFSFFFFFSFLFLFYFSWCVLVLAPARLTSWWVPFSVFRSNLTESAAFFVFLLILFIFHFYQKPTGKRDAAWDNIAKKMMETFAKFNNVSKLNDKSSFVPMTKTVLGTIREMLIGKLNWSVHINKSTNYKYINNNSRQPLPTTICK